jgi:hypothetical protein
MFTQGSYLRVLTPRTTNGNNLLIDGDKVVYKEDHLPITAKKYLEIYNASLPHHLKKRIEVVQGNVSETKEVKNEELINAQNTIQQLQKKLEEAQKQNQAVNKPAK